MIEIGESRWGRRRVLRVAGLPPRRTVTLGCLRDFVAKSRMVMVAAGS